MSWVLLICKRIAIGHCCTHDEMESASNGVTIRGLPPCIPVGGVGGRAAGEGAQCGGRGEDWEGEVPLAPRAIVRLSNGATAWRGGALLGGCPEGHVGQRQQSTSDWRSARREESRAERKWGRADRVRAGVGWWGGRDGFGRHWPGIAQGRVRAVLAHCRQCG